MLGATKRGLLAACLGLAAHLVAARPAAAGRRGAVAGPMTDLAPLVGTWECLGVSTDPDSGTQQHAVGRVALTWLDDNRWLADEARLHRADGSTYASWGWTHWDAGGQRFSRWVGSNQGELGHFTSPGWQGEVWTWTGAAQGLGRHRADLQHTLERQGPDAWRHEVAVATGSDWTVVWSGQCARR